MDTNSQDSDNRDERKSNVWPPPPVSTPNWQEQIAAEKENTKLRWQVRVFGAILFLFGFGMAWSIRSDVISGAKVSGKIVIATPIVLMGALGFVVEPRLMLASMKNADPRLKPYKIAGYIVCGIGLAIGLYIVFTFFS